MPSAPVSGVLPAQAIAELIETAAVSTSGQPIRSAQVQPASLDLRVGTTAYRLQSSFLPGALGVKNKLKRYVMDEIDLTEGAVLERDRPYLIPLAENLNLPSGLRARANPRSSTGRLDILTRVVTEHGYSFDDIPAGYHGPLYLELVSRTFTIKLKAGHTLNQVRFIRGNSRFGDQEIEALHTREKIVFRGKTNARYSKYHMRDGLLLSVDLGGQGLVGYRGKRNSALLDLSKRNHYDPADFWEDLRPTDRRTLILEPEEFYLLVSLERVRIPPTVAAEMAAYDPTSGELRTHYAGFFDPGFGYDVIRGLAGTPAVLEVRAHDVPFMIEHGQRLCKLTLERMSAAPESLYGENRGSRYQRQYLALAPQFKQRRSASIEAAGLAADSGGHPELPDRSGLWDAG